MQKFPDIFTEMSDVYGEADEKVAVRVYEDLEGGLTICDGVDQHRDSTFLIYVENRNGVPYLVAWTDPEQFGNDPQHTIRLRP